MLRKVMFAIGLIGLMMLNVWANNLYLTLCTILMMLEIVLSIQWDWK